MHERDCEHIECHVDGLQSDWIGLSSESLKDANKSKLKRILRDGAYLVRDGEKIIFSRISILLRGCTV